MHTHRSIALILLVVTMLTLCACKEQPVGTSETFEDNGKHILQAWDGAFSEEELKNAITVYEQGYTPLCLDDTWQASLTFDQAIDSYSITRVSPVGEDFSELQNFVNFSVPAQYNKESGTLVIDCSFMNTPENSATAWSFLIKVTSGGKQIRYYVRVYYPNT